MARCACCAPWPQSIAELRVIDLARNYGQTAAMMAGIDHARGSIIVPIDADLQNDPADIPRLLAKLDEGYDVVSGWRQNRQDATIRRNFVSNVANKLISRLSGVRLHDYGCSLKAYRRSVLAPVRLYGEMHRFVPIYASWYGARITEIPVNHNPRLHGRCGVLNRSDDGFGIEGIGCKRIYTLIDENRAEGRSITRSLVGEQEPHGPISYVLSCERWESAEILPQVHVSWIP